MAKYFSRITIHGARGAVSDLGAKRTQTDVIVEILNFCTTPTRKTRIMHKVNMSYPQLLKNIERLQKSELLRFNADKETYQTTEKGSEFLKRYSRLLELLKPKAVI